MTMETDAATLVDGTRLSPQQLGIVIIVVIVIDHNNAVKTLDQK